MVHQLKFFMFDDVSKTLACDSWLGKGTWEPFACNSLRLNLFLAMEVSLDSKRCLVEVLSRLLPVDII